MRVAVLLQGEPRFSKEFDIFLDNLKDTDIQYDWYVYLWNHNPGPDLVGFKLIPDSWRSFTSEWAVEKMCNLLPSNHRIVSLVATDHKNLSFPDVISRKPGETITDHVWKMFYSLRQVDLLRQSQNMQYDLVLKCRADVSATNLNCRNILGRVNENPRQIFVSKENHHGYDNVVKINDWVAVGSPEAMQIYCGVYDKIPEYCQSGFIFHPESLLSRHLTVNGLSIVYGDYLVGLRYLGQMIDRVYHSDFSHWA